MRRSAGRHHGKPGLTLVLAGIFLAVLTGQGWGFTSAGVTLELFVDQEHEGLNFVLGQEPVKLILSIQNAADAPIVTERGYSQVELYDYIFVTDPAGVWHVLGQDSTAHKMPPPFFINDKPWGLAETLPADWVRTVVIDDLRTFLPVMGSTPGWYTLEARQPFLRFSQSGWDAGLGLLGLLDHSGNWNGTITSKPLQLLIAPSMGAQLRLGVTDASADPPAPLSQVPVKVFKTADIGSLSPAEAWGKAAPVLSGATAMDGQAVWEEGTLCLSQGSYTAIAEVKGQYLQSPIAPDDPGWQSGCASLLSRQIEAGGETGVPIKGFSLFALNSLSLGTSAVVQSGNVGARAASPGPVLSSGAEVALETKASVKPGVVIYGDSVYLGTNAVVYDVHSNELTGNGEVKGERFTPLTLPVAEPPAFKQSEPGSQNISVGAKKSQTISPGAYRDVTVGAKATLRLEAGVYQFKSLAVDTSAAVVCSGKTEIRVKNRFSAGTSAVLGQDPKQTLGAREIVLYVGGINGSAGGIDESPKAAELGTKSSVSANIFAPGGTILIGTSASLTGAVIARDILVGTGAQIRHDSAF